MTNYQALYGRHVRLEPLRRDHTDALLAAATEPDASYPYTAVPCDAATAARYVEDALAEHRNGAAVPFAVISRLCDVIVGSTRFLDLTYWTAASRRDDAVSTPSAAEIGGTWLAKSAQRTAVNTETKLLMLQFAFEVWKVERMTFKTDVRNARSRTAIERLGATFEGIRRRHMPAPDGTIRDTAYYSVLASEWPWVNQHLNALLARYEDPRWTTAERKPRAHREPTSTSRIRGAL